MSARSLATSWHYRSSPGNRLTLYTVGDEAFEAAFDAVRTARERVWVETYIFEPDEVGNMLRDALVDAAHRGCSVILIFDRWGSPKIGESYAQPILDAGGQVAIYNPVFPWRRLGRKIAPVFHRDHRKILITDDVGFCGGANVSLDYGGPGPELFYDLTLKIEGPAVQDLAALFLETLRETGASTPDLPTRPNPFPDGVPAEVLSLDARQGEKDFDHALQELLAGAQECCLLMTPYFVPPNWFREALKDAARRGVRVEVLTAGKSDVPLARVAGRHLYRELLEAGVRVFEMQHPVLHAKCLTIDHRYSIVGSYNVDTYGSKYNLEVGIASSDTNLAAQLEEEFRRRTADARKIFLEEWVKRPLRARLFQRLMYTVFKI